MFKLTATFFIFSMMAAVIGFTTDIDAQIISIARYAFFACIGLTFLCAVIGAAMKRSRVHS